MAKMQNIERLLSTEQISARDENLALLEKINKMAAEMNELKKQNTQMFEDRKRMAEELNLFNDERLLFTKRKMGRNDSNKNLHSRSRSMTIQTQEKPESKDLQIAELRNTIQKQEEIIASLKNSKAVREGDESARESQIVSVDLPFEVKNSLEHYDSPIYPRKYRSSSQQNDGIQLSGFNLRLAQIDENEDFRDSMQNSSVAVPYDHDYIATFTERGNLSVLKAGIVMPIGPEKTQDFKHENHDENEQTSLVDMTSVSVNQNENRNERAQTSAINLTMNSSMIENEDQKSNEKDAETPQFNNKVFFTSNFQDNINMLKTKDDMDNFDSRSEKRDKTGDLNVGTARLRPVKSRVKETTAIFTQFYKNFRNGRSKATFQDFSRDYLDALRRNEIVAFLRQVKDKSLLAFSDAIGIYRDSDRKYQYILLVTCSFF